MSDIPDSGAVAEPVAQLPYLIGVRMRVPLQAEDYLTDFEDLAVGHFVLCHRQHLLQPCLLLLRLHLIAVWTGLRSAGIRDRGNHSDGAFQRLIVRTRFCLLMAGVSRRLSAKDGPVGVGA